MILSTKFINAAPVSQDRDHRGKPLIMKLLILGEESQAIANQWRAVGHEAFSVDLQECSGGHPEYHLQMDWMEAIDLMLAKWGEIDLIIFHPVCKKIALCGNGTYGKGMPKHAERLEAIEYTKATWEKVKKSAKAAMMENPKNVMGPHIGKRSQSIHPWQFGHPEQKETWLWLHNLPPLKETENVRELMMTLPKSKRERIFYASPGDDRSRIRSKTYTGIAAATLQWAN